MGSTGKKNDPEMRKLFFESILSHCQEMRRHYKHYIAIYSVNLGAIVLLPILFYREYSKTSPQTDIFTNIAGFIVCIISSLLIIVSLRIFCRETRVNIYHMRMEQFVRELIMKTHFFPAMGLKPRIKKININDSTKKSYCIIPEPSKGYFDAVYIILTLSGLLLFSGIIYIIALHKIHFTATYDLSSFDADDTLIKLRVFLAISMVLTVWCLTIMIHASKAICHLTCAKGITPRNPDPAYPTHPKEQLFYLDIFIVALVNISCYILSIIIPDIVEGYLVYIYTIVIITNIWFALLCYEVTRIYHIIYGIYIVGKANIEQFKYYREDEMIKYCYTVTTGKLKKRDQKISKKFPKNEVIISFKNIISSFKNIIPYFWNIIPCLLKIIGLLHKIMGYCCHKFIYICLVRQAKVKMLRNLIGKLKAKLEAVQAETNINDNTHWNNLFCCSEIPCEEAQKTQKLGEENKRKTPQI